MHYIKRKGVNILSRFSCLLIRFAFKALDSFRAAKRLEYLAVMLRIIQGL